jgi:nucleolin
MKMGRPGGYAFIEFSSVEDAQHAIDILSREQIADRQPTVNFGSPRPAGGDRPFRNDRAPSPPSSLLFIGGLRQLGADELNQVIRENSTDTSVRYPVDFETGEPKGFAFVQAASVADATELKERLSEVIWPHGINPRIDYGQPREDSTFQIPLLRHFLLRLAQLGR